MSRIVKELEIGGRRLKALFDTGAVHSYITQEFRPEGCVSIHPRMVGLGGSARRLEERCIVIPTIEGLPFEMTAYVVDELVETEYGRIDLIVGALTIEEWWMKLDPKEGTIDLTQVRRRDLTEY